MKAKLFLTLLILVSLCLTGCKEEPEAAPAETAQAEVQEPAAAVAAVEQTTCPVMGGAVNKAIFIEHQGKKVYFCCDPCKDKFKEAPEQYIAKLPQFNQ